MPAEAADDPTNDDPPEAADGAALASAAAHPATPRPPSVDRLARELASSGLPHPLLVEVAREAIAAGDVASAATRARAWQRRLLQPVVNATGVLLHTNLGRAPLAHHQDATYTNLEFRLSDGRRGSRSDHVAALWARACGAEAALVVNNCASAVLLTLAALGAGRAVAVSRSELVEIGGGFRVPDVMAQSGADLVEVGTTNRTRLADFERAIAAHGDRLALVLKVHQSNYRIVGFTETVEVPELARLGRTVVADIGSGLVDAACPWLRDGPPGWLAGEPAARQTLASGADLVLFSGDKLAGGPQAGIIAGRADLVAACGRHPLARALRPGGLVLAALQDLALAYLDRRGADIPFWRMASLDVAALHGRARSLGVGAPTDLAAVPGGGTLPGVEIPSAGVAVQGDHAAALRSLPRPIIARVEAGATLLDLRTVDPADDGHVAASLRQLG
ncbi:MAG: L-seryl-tRNA(Sec) selenium transferase [Acidimicrobiia bacterium]|nr:L-seryl-tRNA(Sec) selenium transferase [Acidimicrobiia bacterium]